MRTTLGYLDSFSNTKMFFSALSVFVYLSDSIFVCFFGPHWPKKTLIHPSFLLSARLYFGKLCLEKHCNSCKKLCQVLESEEHFTCKMFSLSEENT
jgi:hypothetical protein